MRNPLAAPNLYQFRVVFRGISPLIWPRILRVGSNKVPGENDTVTSGNAVLKLLWSQGFLSKGRLPQICENAKHS
jgi:hypothetical protein